MSSSIVEKFGYSCEKHEHLQHEAINDKLYIAVAKNISLEQLLKYKHNNKEKIGVHIKREIIEATTCYYSFGSRIWNNAGFKFD